MIPGLPNPWIILGVVIALMASAVGGFFYGGHVKDLSWQAAMRTQESNANALYVDALNKNADLERSNSALARNVDEQHAKDQALADATRDDFAKRLRNALSRKSSCGTTSGQTSDPGIGQNTPGSGDGGSGESHFEAGRQLREYALDLQRYARACHSWAIQVGQ